MHLFSRQGILQRKYEKLFHLLLLFFLTISVQAGEKTFTAGDWSFTCDSENGYWKELNGKYVFAVIMNVLECKFEATMDGAGLICD